MAPETGLRWPLLKGVSNLKILVCQSHEKPLQNTTMVDGEEKGLELLAKNSCDRVWSKNEMEAGKQARNKEIKECKVEVMEGRKQKMVRSGKPRRHFYLSTICRDQILSIISDGISKLPYSSVLGCNYALRNSTVEVSPICWLFGAHIAEGVIQLRKKI